MKNLINLYTDELRERPLPYGLPWLATMLLLSASLMLGYGLWTQQRLAAMETEQQQLQARQQAVQQSIATLEGQMVKEDRLGAMEQEIARLHQANARREMLLDKLQGLMHQPREGFSPKLRGLAAAHGQGVWLTRIQLTFLPPWQNEGSSPMEVRLFGRMHQGQQLPRYMDALARTEAFRGFRFNGMQAQRLENEGAIAFLISTRADDRLQGEE